MRSGIKCQRPLTDWLHVVVAWNLFLMRRCGSDNLHKSFSVEYCQELSCWDKWLKSTESNQCYTVDFDQLIICNMFANKTLCGYTVYVRFSHDTCIILPEDLWCIKVTPDFMALVKRTIAQKVTPYWLLFNILLMAASFNWGVGFCMPWS